ncbi:ATP-binding protein [Candidatus Micrarchaeota archaeon]|nr:ATP-binding protein [Candidatus Micrarchaeota archaeon]
MDIPGLWRTRNQHKGGVPLDWILKKKTKAEIQPTVRIKLHDLLGMAKYNQPRFAGYIQSIAEAVDQKTDAPPAEHGRRPDFLKHEVRELAEQQFTPARAVGELVSNAVDAVRSDPKSKKIIDVTIRKGLIRVSDDGAGMDLNTVLHTLSVPFQSTTAQQGGIGRFGVGFLSNFSFLHEGHARSLQVLTRKDGEPAHSATYEKSNASGPSEYTVGIQRAEKTGRGTQASIYGVNNRPLLGEVKDNVADMFRDVQDVRIRLNGRVINARKKSKTERQYTLSYEGQPITVRIDYAAKGGQTRLTQGGVGIESHNRERGGRLVIDLPTSFMVGEGRRGFVMNAAYVKALGLVFPKLLDYVKTMQPNIPFFHRKRFETFINETVFATSNHVNNVIHPFDAFARTAPKEDLLKIHDKWLPGLLNKEKPMVHDGYDPNGIQHFMGQDANVLNRRDLLRSGHYQHNPAVMDAEQFLTKRTVESRQLTPDEMSRWGMRFKESPLVHFVELSPDNAVPMYRGQIGNFQEGFHSVFYINRNHALFSSGATSKEAILRQYGRGL